LKAAPANDRIELRLRVVFVLVAVISLGVSIAALRNISRSLESSDWVNHTHAVILRTDAIPAALHAGEAALRDYLLTGDERALADSRVAFSEMAENLEIAKALTRREEVPQTHLARLEQLAARRVDFARAAVAARQQGGETAVRQVVTAQAGDTALEEIRREALALKTAQQSLLQARDQESYLQAQATRWTVSIGAGVNVALLLFLGWLVRDDIRARRRAATALQDANVQLEARVAERTRSLADENLERQWQNQALEHQLRYHQLIVNSIDDLVFVTTRTLKITRINPASARELGIEARELVGQPLLRHLRVVGEDTGAADGGRLGAALRAGRELPDSPGELLAKTGAKPVRLALFPLRDRDKVVGAVVTARLRPAEGQSG
jgi:CHASE3 domain sensor protein